MDVYCIYYIGKFTVQIDNTLQFALVSKKLNVSPAKLTRDGQLIISFFTLKIIMDVCCISYMGKSQSKLTTLFHLHQSLKKIKCLTNITDMKWITHNLFFFTLKIIMDVCCINSMRKITVQIDNTLQFALVCKKLNVSPSKLT